MAKQENKNVAEEIKETETTTLSTNEEKAEEISAETETNKAPSIYLLEHEDSTAEDLSLEPQKKHSKRSNENCHFYDSKLVSFITKYGYIGFVFFAGLSILFSLLNVEWFKNALNVLFMSLALLSYAIQKTIELVYSKRCACDECKSEYKPLLTRMLIGYLLFIVGIICFSVFYAKIMA